MRASDKREACFVAIDLGASGGRVLLGSWDGARFGLRELHRFANGPVAAPGGLYWNALGLWSEIKIGLARAQRAQPSSVGVDAWGVDFALLDARGRLLANPYHYRDARTDGVPDEFFARFPRDRLYALSGVQIMQINTVFQLYSMTTRQDPLLAAADKLLMIPDLIHFWLSGSAASEYTIASTSGLLDARSRRWSDALLGAAGVPPALMPRLVEPGSVLGELFSPLARELGFARAPLVVAPGSHDTASAVAAIPELDDTSAFISSGTWSLVGVEVFEPVLSDAALAQNVTNEGGVGGTVRLLKNVSGLWLLQEAKRQWGREGKDYSWDELLALGAAAKPFGPLIDPDDPAFLPPGDMPGAIRSYCARRGQTPPESVGEVVRCCLESLALKYRWVVEALERLSSRSIVTLRVVGGGSQNALLCQLTADACGRLLVAGPVEATALGNLAVQALALGELADLAAARRAVAASFERRHYQPSAANQAAWDAARARFSSVTGLVA